MGTEVIFIVAVFIFGSVIGSFLNVVIYRYNTGFSLGGRSFCLYCGETLSWYEMLPIISYFLLSGRCATCKSRLSLQYPLVEITTALFFTIIYIYGSGIYFAAENYLYISYIWFIGSLLIIIAAYDIRHKIIPDGIVYFFILISIIRPVFFPAVGEEILWSILAGPILALPFALFFFLSGGKLMGFGDAKLALGMGWLLGLWQGLMALALSFWIGGLFAIILLCLKPKSFTMKSEIPFAPFLVLGTFIALLVPTERLFSYLIFP